MGRAREEHGATVSAWLCTIYMFAYCHTAIEEIRLADFYNCKASAVAAHLQSARQNEYIRACMMARGYAEPYGLCATGDMPICYQKRP